MRMTEIEFDGQRPVDGYGPAGFRIGGVWQPGSLILTAQSITGFDPPLAPGHLAGLIAGAVGIDVVLVGQGAEIAPLAPDLRAALEAAGLGVEIMSTPSAARTYNVLLAEGRRVAAILIAV